MKYKMFLIAFVQVLIMITTSVQAATVSGNAFKNGASDHSEITIMLTQLPGVPAIGGIGIVLLLMALGWFLYRKRRAGYCMAIIAISGVFCVAYAAIMYETMTNFQGEWSINEVVPGLYRPGASAPG